MNDASLENPVAKLLHTGQIHINLPVPELIEHALRRNEGVLLANGALAVSTGKYTGRSPKDRFIVSDEQTRDQVDWQRNQCINETVFTKLRHKLADYLNTREETYVFRGFIGAAHKHRLAIQVVNEYAWQNLFSRQLFIEPSEEELENHHPQFTILSAPGFKADPVIDGTRSEAFIILSIKHRTILIGGTEYAGEIKKSLFTIMNFLLPQKGILPMHCSANQGQNGKSALFFGLSGTGKTTLSNASGRPLIGDDEHGWSSEGIFNFEGGCYAKTIRLSPEKEPQIYNSIKFGTVLENVAFSDKSRLPDYASAQRTENTRAAFSLQNVAGAKQPSVGGHPSAIIFLTADAFGVLPPVSILSPEQAMYYFLSGYTSKLAGTERGVTAPEKTFSTCFGAPFMPLPAPCYADLLGQLMHKHNVSAYLINTGWTGGPYGIGKRIRLSDTRTIVQSALDGQLNNVACLTDPIFQLRIPTTCPGISNPILLPWKTWANQTDYQQAANQLAHAFHANFKQFAAQTSERIRCAGPALR
ncbi:phosphoenolpyruvate carboxykinase (ATP) [Sporolactobacillus inulinus]|uniref:Phosphoenolpyruvate carboxykinase (ATP) n=2 Tax=Sporolactobacillus inulinus TaxID=2078 RepID=A0A0U1QPU7_9BACL|nr:phosphoenolpyruvate carboxykinase (ATP) [Sporolactobacillus inulinus]KLI02834.1 phosphoenolpyruvate carboxykinase [Sporolactobacillus inulinus CASD]GEB75761.1 phosphoenolpyruvate carboxykinase [ATP] [Sporolactobacillus inulinus]